MTDVRASIGDFEVMPVGSQERMRDHADIGWAMNIAGARWEAFGCDYRGELVFNGLRFSTELDECFLPKMTIALRLQIAKARGSKPTSRAGFVAAARREHEHRRGSGEIRP